MQPIYLDYNATTPLKPAVYEAMLPYLKEAFGNASSVHWAGRQAKEALMIAKENIGKLLTCDTDEIIFTSGGTEANNLALKGTFHRLKYTGRHIITTHVEHSSILDCSEHLESLGATVTKLKVDSEGLVDPEELRGAIRADTILISIQTANNETGVIQEIKKLSAIAKEKSILFHTDAVQAVGKIPVDVMALGVDMLTLSSHKISGPKGIGALYLKKGIKLEALIHGGNQERKRRGGTENIPSIVGFGKACELLQNDDSNNVWELRNLLETELLKIRGTRVNGQNRVPNTLNVTFEGIENESLLLNLDIDGIAASSGAACSSGSLDPSHVLLAMGRSEAVALSSIRFSLGYQNTKSEIEAVIHQVKAILEDLR